MQKLVQSKWDLSNGDTQYSNNNIQQINQLNYWFCWKIRRTYLAVGNGSSFNALIIKPTNQPPHLDWYYNNGLTDSNLATIRLALTILFHSHISTLLCTCLVSFLYSTPYIFSRAHLYSKITPTGSTSFSLITVRSPLFRPLSL